MPRGDTLFLVRVEAAIATLDRPRHATRRRLHEPVPIGPSLTRSRTSKIFVYKDPFALQNDALRRPHSFRSGDNAMTVRCS